MGAVTKRKFQEEEAASLTDACFTWLSRYNGWPMRRVGIVIMMWLSSIFRVQICPAPNEQARRRTRERGGGQLCRAGPFISHAFIPHNPTYKPMLAKTK